MTYTKTIYLVDSDGDDRFIYQQVIAAIDETILVRQSTSVDEFLSLVMDEGLEESAMILVDTYDMVGIAGLNDLLTIADRFKVPTIMITSFSTKEVESRALTTGVSKWYRKPVSFSELLELLKDLIATHL